MKILLAEDSITSINYMKNILQRNISNLTLDIVKNGEEALIYLKNNHYHLILLDWNMPIKNGFDVLIELQSVNIKNHNTPVIMVTTEGKKTEVVSALKLGVKGYIVKPYSEKTLMNSIREVVNAYYS